MASVFGVTLKKTGVVKVVEPSEPGAATDPPDRAWMIVTGWGVNDCSHFKPLPTALHLMSKHLTKVRDDS